MEIFGTRVVDFEATRRYAVPEIAAASCWVIREETTGVRLVLQLRQRAKKA